MPTVLDSGYPFLYKSRYHELSRLPLETDLPDTLPAVESLRDPVGPEEQGFMESLLKKHTRLLAIRLEMSPVEAALRQQLLRWKKPLTKEQLARHREIEVAGIEAFEDFVDELADLYGSGLVIPRDALLGSLRAPFARRGGNAKESLHAINAELVTSASRTRMYDAKAIKEHILDADLDALANILVDLLPSNPELKRILALS